jgi:glycosyltransferase involved in cell wall biosynthesis
VSGARANVIAAVSAAARGDAPDGTREATRRPEVVVLTNVPTPYRLALHNRIDREMPEVRLLTIYTHDAADQAWALDAGDPDRVFRFGQGESVASQGRLGSAWAAWSKGGRIGAWLRARKPAALLLCGYNDLTRLRALAAARSAGIPTFLVGDSNIHGDSATGLKGLIKHTLVRGVVRRCAGVMPCGTLGAAYFKKYGARDEATYFVPYEPDYDLIRALPASAIDKARAKHGLDPGRRRVVFCARMIDIKRPAMAVRTFAAVAEQRPEWDLVMIGDGPERAAAEAEVPAALRGRVRFTGFIGDQAEVSAIYRCSDVFLHPCVYEPWGVVINESVAAGLAVVACAHVGAAAELVQDGVNGHLVGPDDAPGFTRALLDATDPGRLEALKAGSAGALADWRKRGDPVEGLRRALRSVGVLGGASGG